MIQNFMAALKYLLKFNFQEIFITGITFDRDGFHESYKNKKDDDFVRVEHLKFIILIWILYFKI